MSRFQTSIGAALSVVVVNIALQVDGVHLSTVTGLVMAGTLGLLWGIFGHIPA